MFSWVHPIHIVALGLLGMLFAGVGSTILVDEQVSIPPNDYVQYAIQVYPGQSIQTAATVQVPGLPEYERNMLEILIMDDENYRYFESENYNLINERYRVLVGSNYWEYLKVDARWFGTVHVVLNNKIRVSDRDMAKDVTVRITRYKPLGYIGAPSLVVLIYGAVQWGKEYNVRGEDEKHV